MDFDDVEFKSKEDEFIYKNLEEILYALVIIREDINKMLKLIEMVGDTRFDTAKLFLKYLHEDSKTKIDIMKDIEEEIYGSLLD